MLLELFLLLLGIGFLVKGSDLLVDSTIRIAISMGVSAMVVGMTMVAMGTSLPELVVGVDSAIRGTGQVSLGNVIGANLANICLILGVAAIIRSIKVSPSVAREDIPLTAVFISVLLIMSLDGVLNLIDGCILVTLAAGYFYFVYARSKREGIINGDSQNKNNVETRDLLILITGIILVLSGGVLTVDAAIVLAEEMGISPYLIGVTIVALGTTLPELTTGAIASWKGQGDIALGNSLGSVNVNTLLVLGTASIIKPILVTEQIDIMIVLLSCILLVPMILRGYRLSKWEGSFLILFYAVYIAFKVM